MKKQINEIKRMQFLAGLITETESKTPTPQQVVSIIPKLEDKLEKSPEIKSMGDKIAADPKAVEQLMNILKQATSLEYPWQYYLPLWFCSLCSYLYLD